jgi:hypothetical protein
VLLDDHRVLGQLADFGVAQQKRCALGLVDVDGLDRRPALASSP